MQWTTQPEDGVMSDWAVYIKFDGGRRKPWIINKVQRYKYRMG